MPRGKPKTPPGQSPCCSELCADTSHHYSTLQPTLTTARPSPAPRAPLRATHGAQVPAAPSHPEVLLAREVSSTWNDFSTWNTCSSTWTTFSCTEYPSSKSRLKVSCSLKPAVTAAPLNPPTRDKTNYFFLPVSTTLHM